MVVADGALSGLLGAGIVLLIVGVGMVGLSVYIRMRISRLPSKDGHARLVGEGGGAGYGGAAVGGAWQPAVGVQAV